MALAAFGHLQFKNGVSMKKVRSFVQRKAVYCQALDLFSKKANKLARLNRRDTAIEKIAPKR